MAQDDCVPLGQRLEGETETEYIYRIAVWMAREASEETTGMVETILSLRQQLREARGGVPVPDDMRQVVEMLHRLESRVLVIEKQLDDAAPGPRVQLFVREFIKPIQDSLTSTEHAMKGIARDIADISKQQNTLFATHDAFLQEKMATERAQREAQTVTGRVKALLPTATLVVAVVAIFRVLGTLFEAWLQARTAQGK